MSRITSIETPHSRQAKSQTLALVWAGLAVVVLSRIFFVQIVKGDYYSALSYDNMMRLKIKTAPRGVICDRNGKALVRNRPSFSISLTYHKLKNPGPLIENLIRVTNPQGAPVFDRSRLKEDFARARFRRFEAVKLADDVDLAVVSVIQEHIGSLPGITVETEARREYPYGKLACHALGYLGEIPEDQFEAMQRDKSYRYGDLIGIAGVEKQYENFLRGQNGQEYIRVDAFGQELGRVIEMPARAAVKGREVHLTLDLALQQAAEAAFPESLNGALVAIDPRNGEILAMLSSPRFDPNIFAWSSVRRNPLFREMMINARKPLLNRATVGTYPPGSTYKLVTAAAAINENIVDPNEHFKPCFGSFVFGSRAFGCWNKKGHGTVDFVEGIKTSCDVYFYQVGIKTGIEYLAHYAKMFGLGRKTGIDFPEEAAGEVLDEEIYNRKFKERGWIWTAGQVLNSAIGQAQVISPIQLANYAAALGNGHTLFRPHLFLNSPNPGAPTEIFKTDTLGRIELKSHVLELLHKGLEAVIEPGGTGGRSRVEGVRVGGKTGTAQNPQGEDHALFFAVAPLDHPEIAIGVIVENAGHGGTVAAPIAGQVLNAYFNVHGKQIQPGT